MARRKAVRVYAETPVMRGVIRRTIKRKMSDRGIRRSVIEVTRPRRRRRVKLTPEQKTELARQQTRNILAACRIIDGGRDPREFDVG